MLHLAARLHMNAGVISRPCVACTSRTVVGRVEDSDGLWLLTEPWMSVTRKYAPLHAHIITYRSRFGCNRFDDKVSV